MKKTGVLFPECTCKQSFYFLYCIWSNGFILTEGSFSPCFTGCVLFYSFCKYLVSTVWIVKCKFIKTVNFNRSWQSWEICRSEKLGWCVYTDPVIKAMEKQQATDNDLSPTSYYVRHKRWLKLRRVHVCLPKAALWFHVMHGQRQKKMERILNKHSSNCPCN